MADALGEQFLVDGFGLVNKPTKCRSASDDMITLHYGAACISFSHLGDQQVHFFIIVPPLLISGELLRVGHEVGVALGFRV